MINDIVSITTAHILPAAASFIASFVGAWLAARFALYRFYQEKVWERKTAAYTAIFEALHGMGRWFDVHIENTINGRNLPKETADALTAEYNEAKVNLQRRLAAEVWLIPADCMERIDRLNEELRPRAEQWMEMLENAQDAVCNAVADLRRMARVDLNLERPPALIARCWRNAALTAPQSTDKHS